MEAKNILIIDDEQDICMLLAAILRSFGHKVSFENNLKEGVDNALKQTPDIVFLDLNLPDGAGFTIISSLKKLHPAVKIIIISAYDNLREKTRAMLEGADYFVGKPFNREHIKEALSKAIINADEIINKQ